MQNSNPSEIVGLIARHQTRLRGLVRCLLVRSSDVEDVLQEVNAVLWEKAGEFQAGTDFWAWASQIARFKALNHIRKYSRDRLVFDDKLLNELADLAHTRLSQMDHRREALEGCLNELPPPQRQLIDLRYAGGHAIEVIAEMIGRPQASIRQTLYPIVVWLHGGGMKGGDKSHPGITVLKPDFFVSRGYVFASLNYRLAPEQKHPAQAEDSAAAIAWLHDHAVEFGGDPNRVFLIGISAGAQLAAVISTNERFLAKHEKNLDIIQAAVILDIGSFDIPTLMEQSGERAPDMYRYTFRDGGNREDWIDCSPFFHVKRGKRIPPMLMYYVAGRDHHAVENQRFADRLTAEGYEATVLAAEGKTHLSIELEIGITGDIPTAEILKFFESQSPKANHEN